MRTLPHLAALALALGALACAGGPATALEGPARADGTSSTVLGDHGPRACPDAGSRERTVADPAEPVEPVVDGTAVVVALDAVPAPPSQAAGPPVACGTLSTSQVPGIPEGRVDAGLDGTRSGNLGALVVAGAGALSVVGSAVVAQRRTAAQQ